MFAVFTKQSIRSQIRSFLLPMSVFVDILDINKAAVIGIVFKKK